MWNYVFNAYSEESKKERSIGREQEISKNEWIDEHREKQLNENKNTERTSKEIIPSH